MSEIITQLEEKLKKDLRSADEIWIAVALMNDYGFNSISSAINKKCVQNYLVGIDLPTDPKTLWKMYKLHLKSFLNAKVFTDKNYFHPKLYLIRKKDKYIGYIGSANCTSGGLNSNIELTIRIDDPLLCIQLVNWFNNLYKNSKPLTKDFLTEYQILYNSRQEAQKQDHKLARREKRKLNAELELSFTNKKEFLSILKVYKRLPLYKAIVKERKDAVRDLRLTLDYPHFENIDVDAFFKIQDLGHIISIPKPTINMEMDRFSLLLKTLCDENIDIALRFDRAISGDLEIRGVKHALISKILTVHNPQKYYVENNTTSTALKNYGIKFPAGLTDGEKYKMTSCSLEQICQQANFENLAVLDYYLYIESKNEPKN